MLFAKYFAAAISNLLKSNLFNYACLCFCFKRSAKAKAEAGTVAVAVAVAANSK